LKETVPDRLGAPALRLAGFQLWVHNREFPEAEDAWDGNWLNVTAHCGAAGGSVWASGALIDTVSILQFHGGLASLHQKLRGEAVLESHEPNLLVRVNATDRAGQLRMQVEITPEHLTQQHWFDFERDQSYLPSAIAQCAALLERFPVRDPKGRGV
jgi:hypothetical protein